MTNDLIDFLSHPWDYHFDAAWVLGVGAAMIGVLVSVCRRMASAERRAARAEGQIDACLRELPFAKDGLLEAVRGIKSEKRLLASDLAVTEQWRIIAEGALARLVEDKRALEAKLAVFARGRGAGGRFVKRV